MSGICNIEEGPIKSAEQPRTKQHGIIRYRLSSLSGIAIQPNDVRT